MRLSNADKDALARVMKMLPKGGDPEIHRDNVEMGDYQISVDLGGAVIWSAYGNTAHECADSIAALVAKVRGEKEPE